MRIFISRLGAYGDVVLTTPLIRKLFYDGHKIIYMTSDRGMEVLKDNPYIEKLIYHVKDSIPIETLGEHVKHLARKNHCEKVIDLSESIEVRCSLHPRDAAYQLPKYERRRTQEKNFYEETFKVAEEQLGMELPCTDFTPDLYFDDDELKKAHSYLKSGFNLLVGLAGSGLNKAYPWSEAVIGSIIKEYGDKVHIITVGDEKCRLIEPDHPSCTNLSGKISMRISMALTGIVQCIITPDTGLLHAAGCYSTPKIPLYGHNSHEVVSKHFKNAFPIQADETKAECSPCFRLIYDLKLQCPTDKNAGGSALCMSAIDPERVFDTFKEIYARN